MWLGCFMSGHHLLMLSFAFCYIKILWAPVRMADTSFPTFNLKISLHFAIHKKSCFKKYESSPAWPKLEPLWSLISWSPWWMDFEKYCWKKLLTLLRRFFFVFQGPSRIWKSEFLSVIFRYPIQQIIKAF